MFGYIMNFVISILVALIFIILGIRQCKSEAPVVMNTGEKPLKPEQLRDVKAWNTKHGKACIVFGIATAAITAVFPFALDFVSAKIAAVVYFTMLTLEIAGLLVYHKRLERLYRIP